MNYPKYEINQLIEEVEQAKIEAIEYSKKSVTGVDVQPFKDSNDNYSLRIIVYLDHEDFYTKII